MPITKRTFILKCFSEEICQELLEKIIENAPIRDATYHIHGNVLKITIVGLKHEVQASWMKIKEIYSEMFKILEMEKEKGLKHIPISYIVKTIRRTFPPEALALALMLKGFKAEVKDEEIVTNAHIDEVISLSRKIVKAIDDLKFRAKGSASKKAISCISAILDLDVDVVINMLRDTDLLVEEDDKVKVKKEWRGVVKEIISRIRTGKLEV